MTQIAPITFATRFRGFLPVVIDVETGGFNPQTDALLEIARTFWWAWPVRQPWRHWPGADQ